MIEANKIEDSCVYQIAEISRKIPDEALDPTLIQSFNIAFEWANTMGLHGKKVSEFTMTRVLMKVYMLCKIYVENISTPIQENDPMSEWISVDDRLPEIGEVVLAYSNEYNVFYVAERFIVSDRVYFDCSITPSYDGHMYRNPTHWMPLPKPPQV